MMTQVSSTIRIDAPADVVWQLISDFGTAVQYHAWVIDCTLEGRGLGSQRTLTHIDGSRVIERLELLDEAALRLRYILLSDTPFGGCVTTMTLHELGPFRTNLVWSATFQTVGIPEHEAAALLRGALAANCLALKQLLER